MADGCMGLKRAQSAQMAALLAMFANVHRNPKRSRVFQLADFDPYCARGARRKKGLPVTPETLASLRRAFKRRGGQPTEPRRR